MRTLEQGFGDSDEIGNGTGSVGREERRGGAVARRPGSSFSRDLLHGMQGFGFGLVSGVAGLVDQPLRASIAQDASLVCRRITTQSGMRSCVCMYVCACMCVRVSVTSTAVKRTAFKHSLSCTQHFGFFAFRVSGVLAGFGRGVVGLFTKPLEGTFEFVESTSRGIASLLPSQSKRNHASAYAALQAAASGRAYMHSLRMCQLWLWWHELVLEPQLAGADVGELGLLPLLEWAAMPGPIASRRTTALLWCLRLSSGCDGDGGGVLVVSPTTEQTLPRLHVALSIVSLDGHTGGARHTRGGVNTTYAGGGDAGAGAGGGHMDDVGVSECDAAWEEGRSCLRYVCTVVVRDWQGGLGQLSPIGTCAELRVLHVGDAAVADKLLLCSDSACCVLGAITRAHALRLLRFTSASRAAMTTSNNQE